MESSTLLTSLVLGMLLGMKHALDADHLVAVSTIVTQSRHFLTGTIVGAFWGLGHTTTLFLMGFLVLAFKLAIPEKMALSLEFLVGIVLVALGIQILWGFRQQRVHIHVHGGNPSGHSHFHAHLDTEAHDHHTPRPRFRVAAFFKHLMDYWGANPAFYRRGRKSFIVGLFHGLAGSAALTLLVLTGIESRLAGLVYIIVFGLGSILAMAVLSTLLGLPFALTAERLRRFTGGLSLMAAAASIALGTLLMVQIGFGEGLFTGA